MLQKDSHLRKYTHGNRRKPNSYGNVPSLRNNSGAQQESHCFLKETVQKFADLDLDSYEGQMILKDKFLPRCASDIGIKLQQLQQQYPDASLAKMVQTATRTSHNRVHEREAKNQEREKRNEKSHAHMLVALQGSPKANPKSLMDKTRGKSLICIQAGH